MKLLSLLRHASADMGNGDDRTRPLTAAGLAEAARVARRLHDSGLAAPGLILASDALRTRQTAEALAAAFPQAHIAGDAALYLSSADAFLTLAMAADDQLGHIVMVGHNPGIGQLAFDLGGGVAPTIAQGFAPATLAVFAYSGASWLDLRPAHLRLERVITP